MTKSKFQPPGQGVLRSATALVISLLLVACATQQPPLNSERIAARFGSYELTLLQQDEHLRVSSLASRHHGQSITRTLALTRFEGMQTAYADVAARIRDGASIGSTFRDAGWQIEKRTLYIGTLPIDADGSVVSRLMAIELPADLAVHIYRFDVTRNGRTLPYATLVELHHPDYLREADLRSIYGSAADDFSPALAAHHSEIRRALSELSKVSPH